MAPGESDAFVHRLAAVGVAGLVEHDPSPAVSSQFQRRRLWPEGERALMQEVLEDALRILAKGAPGEPIFDEALVWVRSVDERWLFSFVNVCFVLGFDAERMAGAVLASVGKRLAPLPRRMPPRVRPSCETPRRRAAAG